MAFDGERALASVRKQVSFGPRTPGSSAHARARAWILTELGASGWSAEVQNAARPGGQLFNIVARRDSLPPRILLGAHYDTRLVADRDPDPAQRIEAGPGANDGASGVAVLLELARTLPVSAESVWLVFFDAEDNGNIEGWDSLLGSRAFAGSMRERPDAVVIVDMVGDADLQIYYESTSDPVLRAAVWRQAERLGLNHELIAEEKHALLDDHTPFLEAGIPAVVIIDFDYPYWHTKQDTVDKVSAQSLAAVGATLWAWITSGGRW
jgi:Zn-dependent M28 family amino/carboxypeptidase